MTATVSMVDRAETAATEATASTAATEAMAGRDELGKFRKRGGGDIAMARRLIQNQ